MNNTDRLEAEIAVLQFKNSDNAFYLFTCIQNLRERGYSDATIQRWIKEELNK